MITADNSEHSDLQLRFCKLNRIFRNMFLLCIFVKKEWNQNSKKIILQNKQTVLNFLVVVTFRSSVEDNKTKQIKKYMSTIFKIVDKKKKNTIILMNRWEQHLAKTVGINTANGIS